MCSTLHRTITAQRTAEWRERAATAPETPRPRAIAPAPRSHRVAVPRPSAVLRRRVA